MRKVLDAYGGVDEMTAVYILVMARGKSRNQQERVKD